MSRPIHVQLRRGTAAQWTATNPVLKSGEMGVELDTDKFKFGDGATPWNALPYASAGGGGGLSVSAGVSSANLSSLVFSNSNGVSFGLNNSTITASVQTNYQTTGNYLTTAMASNRGSDFVQAAAVFAGTNASGTIGSGGISVSVAAGGGGAGSVRFSAGTMSANRTDLTFANSNGISFGLQTDGVITATVATNYQSQAAYLTTAMQSDAATISNVRISAGTLSNNLSAITFSDSNGISFGLSGSVLTGTVATNYQSPGAYLTTAALSQDSSNYAGTSAGITGGSVTLDTAGIAISLPAYLTTAALSGDSSKYAGTSTGITGGSVTLNTSGIAISLPAYLTTAALSADSSKYAGTSTGMTGGSVTLNTSGIAINLPAYLTTAMASDAATISNLRVSAGTTSNLLSRITFSDSNGISFGLNGSTLTATVKTDYQSAGAYLTTAMQSNAATISNINVSAGTLSNNLSAVTFSDSNGISFGLSGSVLTATVATNYQSQGAYLTTAALSGDTSKYAGVGETVGTTAGSDLALTVNTDGVSIAYPKWLTTAQAPGAYLTTAALSQDSSKYAGTSTGMTGGSVTLNTSGIAINLPAYLTTADLSQNSSNYAGVGETVGTIAGSDLAMTVNTVGVSVAYPKWLTTAMLSNAATISNVNISAGTTSTNASAFTFSNANAVSFGLGTGASAGVITASVATVSVITLSAGTASQTFGSIVFSNSNGFSFGLNGSTVTMDGPYASYLNLAPFWFNTVTSSIAQSTSQMIPFMVPQRISIGSVRVFQVGTVAASSTASTIGGTQFSMGGFTTHNFVFYSRGVGASSVSLQYVTSTQIADQVSFNLSANANSTQFSYSLRYSIGNTSFTKDYSSSAASLNFHTSNITDLTGTKQVDYPCGLSLSEGQWFLAYGRSTTASTQNAAVSVATRLNISYDSQFVVTQNTLGAIGTLGGATNSSIMFGPIGLGSFTTGGAAGTTNSLSLSVISSGSSNQIPTFQLIRIA